MMDEYIIEITEVDLFLQLQVKPVAPLLPRLCRVMCP
jgi:hypothetical protein